MIHRCPWAMQDPLFIHYHDEEWGVPLHDERKLFEMLILEGMQAGLSWLTVLKKRENFRTAFNNFDAEKIARYSEHKVTKLLQNPGIIRNPLKINAVIKNAKGFLALQDSPGGFDQYIWQFTDGKTIQNSWKTIKSVPTSTKESDRMAKDLKKRGFNFVGSTICYAFMQAVGMVNDHVVNCFRHEALI